MRLFNSDDYLYDDFSVIIPVYNAEETIVRCLSSLISNREWINEVIIVDDGCTDRTIKLAKKFSKVLPLRILKNTGNRGPGPARQTGLMAAEGAWVTFLDADDCFMPGSMMYVRETIMENLREGIKLVAVHTTSIALDSGDFDPDDNIDCVSHQCCGHFYARLFLIRNNISFHPSLYMDEDEYFTNKLDKFIDFCSGEDVETDEMDYPVYIEMHDPEIKESFTGMQWADYVIKYRFQYRQYIVEDFWDYIFLHEILKNEFIESFVFSYFALCDIIQDPDFSVDIDEQKQHFSDALKFACEKFKMSVKDFIEYIHSNPEIIEEMEEAAMDSTGADTLQPFESIDEFILSL